MKSSDIQEMIATTTSEEVEAAVADQLLEKYGLKIEDILTEEEIARKIRKTIVLHILAFVEASLKACVNEGVDQLSKYLSSKLKNTELSTKVKEIIKAILDFLTKDIVEDVIIARLFAAIKEVKFEDYLFGLSDENETENKDLAEELDKAFKKQIEGDAQDGVSSLENEIQQKFISFAFKEIVTFLMGGEFDKLDQKRMLRVKKNYGFDFVFSSDNDSNDHPIAVVLFTMLRCALGFVKTV